MNAGTQHRYSGQALITLESPSAQDAQSAPTLIIHNFTIRFCPAKVVKLYTTTSRLLRNLNQTPPKINRTRHIHLVTWRRTRTHPSRMLLRSFRTYSAFWPCLLSSIRLLDYFHTIHLLPSAQSRYHTRFRYPIALSMLHSRDMCHRTRGSLNEALSAITPYHKESCPAVSTADITLAFAYGRGLSDSRALLIPNISIIFAIISVLLSAASVPWT